MSDYKKTLQLPNTRFPMKANLTQNEPQMLKFWDENKCYDSMINAGTPKGEFVLHDGPPYANGHLHIGHALNKTLKDIIIKSRNMDGFKAEYVPGWDCHGLPIELKVTQELGEKAKTIPAHAVRKECRKYANKFVDIQRKEFRRLGGLGNWDNPYITMTPAYETATARELVHFMEKGSVIRSKKPVYWCCSCETALAEAEVEYKDHTSPSIFVSFALTDARVKDVLGCDPAACSIAIWTTTPWTIPDNMAVAVHPNFEYAVVRHNGHDYVMAHELVASCAKTFGWEEYEELRTVNGAALEGLVARHPLYDRESPIVLADYVTLETGTGCVHTAPGHGREDYETGLRYGLDAYSPLNDEGRFLSDVEFFAGLSVTEANPKVIEKLQEVGRLLAERKITHSYPHCWRCKKPVIFRATPQWFISMEANDLRQKSLDAIRNDVEWLPSWGEERIYNMVANRPDWCISRQRLWGVPILALMCKECGEAWYDTKWAQAITDKFEKHPTGCDYWFEADLEELVPADLRCPKCGGMHWKKSTDILDVWFDSGTSFAAVVEQRPECRFPADMYLEGSDQHRGWFHSSLLASMGTRGVAPYKSVLTHGYVLDSEGRKMSKSIGNVITPQEIIDKYGAEILRMWVSSVDYHEDVRISEEILNRLVDAYRRIRNTCRYILGNIADLTPEKLVPLDKMESLDRFALDLARNAHERVQKAYKDYEFHKVYHTLHNLCTVDLSAFYLDILKDRLYTDGADSASRRSAQTAIYHILMLLVRDMAPVLSFTAEEVFRHLPEALRPAVPTVFALREADVPNFAMPADERAQWDAFLAVRAELTKDLETVRQAGTIGHPLDAHVTLFASEAVRNTLEALHTDLRACCIVSQLDVKALENAPESALAAEEVEGLRIFIEKASGEKCERCWIWSNELGTDSEHPTLCPRCASVLKNA